MLRADVVDFLRNYKGNPGEPAPLAAEETIDHVEDHRVGDDAIPVRVYAPESTTPLPIIVYYHGGGWVHGDLEMHDRTCRRLTTSGHCIVVNVAYRLAPHHPFPVPMRDCYDALVWAAEHAASLNGDATKLGVAGSRYRRQSGSRGGAARARHARSRARPAGPDLPGARLRDGDPELREASRRAGPHARRDGRLLARQYVPSDADRVNPYASPTFAVSLAGLPRTLIATAEVNRVCDEAREYAARLRAEGVEVTELHYEGQIHGFLSINGDFSDSIRPDPAGRHNHPDNFSRLGAEVRLMQEEVCDVAVIGAGLGGIYASHRFRDQGLSVIGHRRRVRLRRRLVPQRLPGVESGHRQRRLLLPCSRRRSSRTGAGASATRRSRSCSST